MKKKTGALSKLCIRPSKLLNASFFHKERKNPVFGHSHVFIRLQQTAIIEFNYLLVRSSLKCHLLLIFQCLTSNISQWKKCKLIKLLYGLCICTGDNPLAKDHGLSPRTDAHSIQYLALKWAIFKQKQKHEGDIMQFSHARPRSSILGTWKIVMRDRWSM